MCRSYLHFAKFCEVISNWNSETKQKSLNFAFTENLSKVNLECEKKEKEKKMHAKKYIRQKKKVYSSMIQQKKN